MFISRRKESEATDLPVFGHSVPHPHFPCVAGGNQLIPHEEQSLYWNIEAEHPCGTGSGEEGEIRVILRAGLSALWRHRLSRAAHALSSGSRGSVWSTEQLYP